MTLDPSGDWVIFDGREAVTYTSRSARSVGEGGVLTETETETAVSDALRRMATERDVERSGGEVKLSDLAWTIPVSQLSTEPAAEDTITDAAGVVWVVVWHEYATLRSRWRVLTRR